MYSTMRFSKSLFNVTRVGCRSFLLGRHNSSLSTLGVQQNDTRYSHNYVASIPPSTRYKLNKNCVFTPVRLYSDGKKQVTALTLIKDLKNIKSSPMPALVLGFGGLVPFVAPPLYMLLTGTSVASLAFAQGVYGACILSFIGGVRWGMTLQEDTVVKPNWFNLCYSVTPPLVGWFALLMPTTFALTTLIVGLGGAAYMDIVMWGYPHWFKAMRFLLSFTAILSLWTTILLMYAFKDSSKAKSDKSKELTAKPGVVKSSKPLDKESSTEVIDDCWWLEDIDDPIEDFISSNDD
ncbi:Transmembrane protein 69 [Mactra antiquata]